MRFGEFSNSELTSVTFPPREVYTSATAFTLSSTESCSPFSNSVPTSGISTYTTSPSLSWGCAECQVNTRSIYSTLVEKHNMLKAYLAFLELNGQLTPCNCLYLSSVGLTLTHYQAPYYMYIILYNLCIVGYANGRTGSVQFHPLVRFRKSSLRSCARRR